MTKKQFMRAATVATVAAVGLSTVVMPLGQAPAQAANIKLKDVAGHPDEEAILALIDKGMINGYSDGTFKPDRQLTRYDITLIIGRYLVQLGYHIPKDAKIEMRFKDLNRKSEEALLNYAALLHDVGILLGDSQKRLNPNDLLTREQLALILTRAFSIIDDFDYVSHVAGKTFVREFEDTLTLTQQSQGAIEVLDYYDIVEDHNYFPKEYATRGQFATMTYKMMQVKEEYAVETLSIVKADVISAKRVKFTMSDGSTEDILLEEPLVENVPTPIHVTIQGRSFLPTVTYRVQQLKVVNVENINSGQFVVHFNQEVDLVDSYVDKYYSSTWSQTVLQQNVTKFFKLTDRLGRNIALQKGELSEDRKSFKVTIEDRTPLVGSYNLKISGVHAINGMALPTFEDSYYFETDFEMPKVIATERLSTNVVKVKFSEPVYNNTSTFTYRIGNEVVTGVQAKYLDNTWSGSRNATEIVFDLTNAKYRYSNSLPADTIIDVSVHGLRDLAGNSFTYYTSDPLTFQIKKGGPDKVPPRLTQVQQVGAKQFKLTFNEPMGQIYGYQLRLDSPLLDYTVEAVTPVAGDRNSVIVLVDEYLEGDITISTSDYDGVYDESGTEGKFSKTFNFKYDTSPAKVVNTRVIRENNLEYLFVEFDRNVEVRRNASAILEGHYMLRNAKYELYDPEKSRVYPVIEDKKTVKIPLNKLLHTFDREGAKFYTNLHFDNVVTEYGQPAISTNTVFTRTKDHNLNAEQLEVVSVDTSRTDRSITDNKLVVITFNLPVEERSAEETYNYYLGALEIDRVQLNPADPHQVLLWIDTDISAERPFEQYLYIRNLQSENSVKLMLPYYEPIYFTESTPPKYINPNYNNNREIVLNFNEALDRIAYDTFIVTDSNGNRLAAKATTDPSDSSKVIITLENGLIPRQQITISQQMNRKIYDAYLNEATFTPIKITYY